MPPADSSFEPSQESRAEIIRAEEAHPVAERTRRTRSLSQWVVPVLAFLLYAVLGRTELEAPARATAAIGLWMGGWWMTEAIPLAATSLLPLVLLPLAGVSSAKAAAAPYAHPLIFLFLGGFMMANAMERWNLHRRIALWTVLTIGQSPRRLIAGFMVAVGFLSMWVSNTATMLMMLPTGLSVVDLLERRVRDLGEAEAKRLAPDVANFSAALVLGIAYAASIGGVGTLVGTPPNALFAAFLSETYGVQIGFREWFVLGVPVVLVFLPLVWAILTHWVFPFQIQEIPGGRKVLEDELEALGPMHQAEKGVALVFSTVSVLWILRPEIVARVPALSEVKDPSLAILGALVLFLLPSGRRPGEAILDWEHAAKVPWGVLLLFGGGLSLAAAMKSSGVAIAIGQQFISLKSLPPWAVVTGITGTVVLLTEFTSNVATASALLPILAGVSAALGIHPYALMVPSVMAASFAFMLPAATANNAIALGSGKVRIDQMMRAGVWLNLLGWLWISAFLLGVSESILGYQIDQIPAWAKSAL